MKHFLLSTLFVLFSIISVYSQTTQKVLFIGNSYTSVNSLPLLVEEMATNTGDILIRDANTPGGFRFLNHASNTTTLNKINSEDWDYVVLQAQSQETSLGETQLQNEVYPYAASLSNAIRANYECSQPLFYMTWGRENGDATNCEFLPWVCTYEGMDDAIRDTYVFMAQDNNAEVSPAGAVWRSIRENHPSINLYSSDGSHPSLAGSYAAACAFYTMIYKKDPSLIIWDSSLPAAEAKSIRMAVKTIVYDQLSDWDFSINPAFSDFTETINNAKVTFTNTGNEYEVALWDFGDGSTSTAENPVHTYTAIGEYTVSLTTTKCGKTDTKTKNITIANLSLEKNEIQEVHLYPNPASTFISLLWKENQQAVKISIVDLNGKTIMHQTVNVSAEAQLDISTLTSGIYFIRMTTNTGSYTFKFLKK
ncbi:T9SS type A sorting domain-containing protein [Mesonia ostreae]|uniref:T9SS type A sorting domain-containing protein n=1 Tax=Mesonia ostreae TaxID=861110 RepID=A0ABU2KIL3_9FLAO|nr:T9SS type A sorting domain-containing protein [Mesonia ostreae]MDT0294560.1 T9SS type A sorting domain-containing protein [Mesonia ostreae]